MFLNIYIRVSSNSNELETYAHQHEAKKNISNDKTEN